MANNNLFTFRCPADLREKIEAEASATGKDKTAVVVGMLRQSLPCLSLYERNTLPSERAIYFVYQGHRLLYIGQTVNLSQRLTTHHRGKQFKSMGDDVQVAWFLCNEDEDLPVIEKSLIDLLEPELNDQPGAPGTTNAKRVTAYVKPATAEKLKQYQQQHEIGVSQAIDQILGEYFAGKRMNVPPPEMEVTPPSDWLISVKGMIEERTQAIAERMETFEQRLGEWKA